MVVEERNFRKEVEMPDYVSKGGAWVEKAPEVPKDILPAEAIKAKVEPEVKKESVTKSKPKRGRPKNLKKGRQ